MFNIFYGIYVKDIYTLEFNLLKVILIEEHLHMHDFVVIYLVICASLKLRSILIHITHIYIKFEGSHIKVRP